MTLVVTKFEKKDGGSYSLGVLNTHILMVVVGGGRNDVQRTSFQKVNCIEN